MGQTLNNQIEIGIISSTQDTASQNIKQHLINSYDWKKEPIDSYFKERDQKNQDNQKNEESSRLTHQLEFLRSKISSYYSLNYHSTKIHLFEFTEKLINLERLDLLLGVSYFIFISKHKSASGIPALTVHSIGNWDKAELGGEPKTLSISWPDFLYNGFKNLKEEAKKENLDIQITPEVTHHGPLIKKPASFIEIGSSEKEWSVPIYGKVISKVVMKTLNDIFNNKSSENINGNATATTNSTQNQINPIDHIVAFAIGGGHYCTSFVGIYDKIHFSHICPKYFAKNLDKEMIYQAIESSKPKANLILLDWKSIPSNDKHRIFEIANQIANESKYKDLKVKKLKELKRELSEKQN